MSAVLLSVLLPSCLQFNWERHDDQSAVSLADEEALVPGQASLADCLALLGAPLLVWEQTGTSYAIAYGWDKHREYGVSASLPLADTGGSASLNYNDVAGKLHGVVFVFDDQDVLVRKRRGFLRDLAPDSAQARPAFLEYE